MSYITVKEARQLYKISKATLDRYIKSITLNDTILYEEDEIVDLINLINVYVDKDHILEHYNISKQFLDKCRHQDKIKYLKIGNKYLYNPEQLTEIQQQYKQAQQDTPYNLVQEFYEELGLPCKNSEFEIRRINNLIKKGYTPEHIRIGFTYLLFNNQKSLYKLKDIIDDSLQEEYWYSHRDERYSIGYIVKQYYNIFNKFFLRRNFFNQCKQIEELLKTNSPIKLLNTLIYMKQNNIQDFNNIKYNIDKANRNIPSTEDLIIYGKQKVQNIFDIQKGTEYFTYKTYYNKKLTRFEYGYLIDLPLNDNLIRLGIEDKQNNPWYCDIDNVTYQKRDIIEYLKKNGVDIKCLKL